MYNDCEASTLEEPSEQANDFLSDLLGLSALEVRQMVTEIWKILQEPDLSEALNDISDVMKVDITRPHEIEDGAIF